MTWHCKCWHQYLIILLIFLSHSFHVSWNFILAVNKTYKTDDQRADHGDHNKPKLLVRCGCHPFTVRVHVCHHACVHTYSASVCKCQRVCNFSLNKTVLSEHARGGNQTTNLPICPLQPWLIEYVRGDESNQKTAESHSRGKSAAEERCVMVNASVDLSVPCWVCE